MSRGYALLATLLFASLCLVLLVGVHTRVVRQWRRANATEDQLHALIAAQNGIEIAASFLPSVKPDTLLPGQDGVFQDFSGSEWRNPVPFREAMTLNPERWTPRPDDGIPVSEGEKDSRGIFQLTDGSFALLRFSNNPEETPEEDHDRVFIARSLGMVPMTRTAPLFSFAHSSLALIEARLRKEEAFRPLAAITLFGDLGQFVWSKQLRVDGGPLPAIAILPMKSPELFNIVKESVSVSGISDHLRGNGPKPSISLFDSKVDEPGQTDHLLNTRFWSHFLSRLPQYAGQPDFSENADPQLAYLSDGGNLDAPFRGLLFSRGDLSLNRGCRIEGLLVHIGPGTLTLQENASIQGGLWICGLQMVNSHLSEVTIRFEVNGAASVVYDPEWTDRALACLPATRLQWRMLFPEMLAE